MLVILVQLWKLDHNYEIGLIITTYKTTMTTSQMKYTQKHKLSARLFFIKKILLSPFYVR